VNQFSFFSVSHDDKDADVGTSFYPYLGLAPERKLNGPSFVKALNETDHLQNYSLSYQLSDWPVTEDLVGNNNITFGGDVQGAFTGHLVANLIL
jgi:hypothetical protein